MNNSRSSNLTKHIRRRLCASCFPMLLLGIALGATAAVQVNFQVDMSLAGIDPSAQTVQVRGNFNGWDSGIPVALTNNPGGHNPYLFTGATNLPLNGSVIAYKYVIQPETIYETNHNRLLALPSANGSTVSAPLAYYNDAPPHLITVAVTLQINMEQQISIGAFYTNVSIVQARGAFNGWGAGAFPQTNDPSILTTNHYGLVTSNVYVYTYAITGSPGQTIDYKYHIDNGNPLDNWEIPAPGNGDPTDNNNRFFNLASGTTQELPLVDFSDQPYAPVTTNAVTFQVDMTVQVLQGKFHPATGTVQVRGQFNNWGGTLILCTNNPAELNTNIYRVLCPISESVGVVEQYKFWADVPDNAGWETIPTNRALTILGGTSQTLPAVYFNNLTLDDVLPVATVTTFSVDMLNAVGTDGVTFHSATDHVFINGVPDGFTLWNTSLPMLTNNPPGSSIYSVALLLPAGTPRRRVYRYGINANDDEAPAGSNHVRYVRAAATYAMPPDTFGQPVVEEPVWEPPTIQTPPRTQTAEAASPAQFSVRASSVGDLALGYQWFFNGTSRLNCTNCTLQLPNVQYAQAGAYIVVVTNAVGWVTSPPALLNVIAPVERRLVPALTLLGQPGRTLNLDFAAALAPAPLWTTFDTVPLTEPSQWYFDLSSTLPPQGFYRAWQSNGGAPPTLDLHFIPALNLTGAVGSPLRVDYIDQFGPTDAWVTLATVTLTNTPQLYFDTSIIGQPPRLWRIVPAP